MDKSRIVVDLGRRYNQAFGFVSSNSSSGLQKAGFADSVKGADVYLADARYSFEEMRIRRGAEEGLRFGYMGFVKNNSTVFAPPPMVSFSKSKTMEETVLDKGDKPNPDTGDVVVERYNHNPWDITIQGLLIDMDNHSYPGEKIRQIVRFFNVDDVMDVESEIFMDHGIKTIYLLDIKTSGVAGYPDTWQFTITAKSIKPVTFDFVK